MHRAAPTSRTTRSSTTRTGKAATGKAANKKTNRTGKAATGKAANKKTNGTTSGGGEHKKRRGRGDADGDGIRGGHMHATAATLGRTAAASPSTETTTTMPTFSPESAVSGKTPFINSLLALAVGSDGNAVGEALESTGSRDTWTTVTKRRKSRRGQGTANNEEMPVSLQYVIVVFGMAAGERGSDNVRLQQLLAHHPRARILSVSEFDPDQAQKQQGLFLHERYGHLSADFKENRGMRKVAAELKRQKLPSLAFLDYFFLQKSYYRERYGANWMKGKLDVLYQVSTQQTT